MSAVPEAFSGLLSKRYLSQDRYPYRKPGKARATFTIGPARVRTMG